MFIFGLYLLYRAIAPSIQAILPTTLGTIGTGLIILLAFCFMLSAVFYRPTRTPGGMFFHIVSGFCRTSIRGIFRGTRRIITVWIPRLYRRIYNWFFTNRAFVPSLTGWRRRSLCGLIAVVLVVVII